MGDTKNFIPTSFSLPPGCRFFPSDEQLICYYLTHKNNDDRRFGFDVISDIDLYNYDPFHLPETTCFRFGRGGRRRHWYCYAARVLKERGRRRAGGGYWKRRGRGKDVVGGGAGKVVVGTRRSFVFYLGDSPESAVRTDWVMYEYALIEHHKASFVVCRVVVESRGGNSKSEHVLSSCGEESVGTVRHIGVQYDASITSGIGDATVHDNSSDDKKNEVLTYPIGPANELDNRIAAVADGFQLPSSIQPTERVSSGVLTGSGAMLVDALDAQQLLMAILEEDFIELDDLLCPLSGIDST